MFHNLLPFVREESLFVLTMFAMISCSVLKVIAEYDMLHVAIIFSTSLLKVHMITILQMLFSAIRSAKTLMVILRKTNSNRMSKTIGDVHCTSQTHQNFIGSFGKELPFLLSLRKFVCVLFKVLNNSCCEI